MWKIELGEATKLPLPSKAAQLVCGSPPYLDRRTYGQTDIARPLDRWVPWMLDVSIEALRVSSGPVIWVVNGGMKDRKYRPAVEGLIWEAYKAGLNCEHPLIWSKNAAPNRKDWWCNGWEYIVAFYPDGWDHHFDWTAVATPQKYMKGGAFRQRQTNGSRKIAPDKERAPMARPYDMIRATVGGGHMGSPLSGENEAAYPESLIEPIIRALTRPGESVVDPFSGSGTTVAVADRLGRYGVGFDCRLSQVLLGRKRLREQHANKAPSTAAEAGPATHDPEA